MMKRSFVAVVGLSLLLAGCGQNSQPGGLSPQVQSQGAQGSKHPTYLVGFKQGKGIDRAAVNKAGGRIQREWAEIETVAAQLNPRAVEALRKNPNVEFVDETVKRYPMRYLDNGADPVGWPGMRVDNNKGWQADGEYTYGDMALNVPDLRGLGHTGNSVGGQRVSVCVVDSGLDAAHAEFAGMDLSADRYKNFADDNMINLFARNDVIHHGTHVAGTIFAQYGATGGAGLTGMDAKGVGGVAPDAKLYVARVFGSVGYATDQMVIDAMLWCAGKAKANNERMVVNLSLGSAAYSRAENRVYEQVYAQGVLSVAAAGNDRSIHPHYPADYKTVMKVGAVDSDGNIASFSNYGGQQEISAPGVSVLSTVPTGEGSTATVDSATYDFQGQVYAGEVAVKDPVSGEEVFVNHASATGVIATTSTDKNEACTAINESLEGKIALIKRGSCTFAVKVQNAIDAGAEGVMIYNHLAGDFFGPYAGVVSEAIPVVGVTNVDGVGLLGEVDKEITIAVSPADYAYYNGTSMATPHVAAAAAVVWSAKPDLSNVELRALLQRTATDLGKPGQDIVYGHGLVNPLAAIDDE